jgi:hypothetical protein
MCASNEGVAGPAALAPAARLLTPPTAPHPRPPSRYWLFHPRVAASAQRTRDRVWQEAGDLLWRHGAAVVAVGPEAARRGHLPPEGVGRQGAEVPRHTRVAGLRDDGRVGE